MFAHDFQCNAGLYINGCGLEQQLEAVWRALIWHDASDHAGNTDPNEPIATFSLSDGREPQWCVYPLNLDDESTNWGQALPEATWWHLAVVNDGKTTVMYVEGCPTVDNPYTNSHGLVELGLPWALGGYQYAGEDTAIWHGFVVAAASVHFAAICTGVVLAAPL